jgi:hypothetical protein
MFGAIVSPSHFLYAVTDESVYRSMIVPVLCEKGTWPLTLNEEYVYSASPV